MTTRVAERVGVSVGTPYPYYPNKQTLLRQPTAGHPGGPCENLCSARMKRNYSLTLPSNAACPQREERTERTINRAQAGSSRPLRQSSKGTKPSVFDRTIVTPNADDKGPFTSSA